ncbi:MAG TPA: hypothetical protein DEG92_09970, partial [Rikenellaceae bacterium]|nr:hypothetical protein [Rikenellaceae bacterium]
YDCAICNFDYEFLLNDDSIFQFSFKNDELRYAFIQNPYIYISKEEYVTTIFTQEEVSEINNIDVLADLIDENEYEQFLNEQELNSISNYIRYDTSLSGYKALNHSYSHIHIGLNPDMRVPLSIILTPLKFIKFCIKTSYYRYWQKAFILIPNFENTLKVSKNKCLNLDRTHWNIKEEYDLYIK